MQQCLPSTGRTSRPHPIRPTFSGASNDTSSRMRSRMVCRRRAPMLSTLVFTSSATRAISRIEASRRPGQAKARQRQTHRTWAHVEAVGVQQHKAAGPRTALAAAAVHPSTARVRQEYNLAHGATCKNELHIFGGEQCLLLLNHVALRLGQDLIKVLGAAQAWPRVWRYDKWNDTARDQRSARAPLA